ncbi:MAG: MerC domain-containing protein [Bacteroidota bacterium]|nr:MerC domain-containing protein [Bacteroidota bacterium]
MKLSANLDKIGTIGLFLAALATPCCFPLLGFLLASFGLGSAELFGGWTEYVFQALVLISLIGTYISYRQHKNIFPLIIALATEYKFTVQPTASSFHKLEIYLEFAEVHLNR